MVDSKFATEHGVCEQEAQIQELRDAVTDTKATNRTWGIAIGGILTGASVIGVPFFMSLASSVNAHETSISVMKTRVDAQDARTAEMAADIKAILSELRKRP